MLPDEPRPPTDRTPEPGGGLAHCYRHPGQETGIGCSRCGRPICPQCMVSASVGFHCPECVQGANREVRQATTRFGGQLAADGALVTKALIGVNLVVFVLAAYVLRPWLSEDLSLFSVGPQITGFPYGVAAGPDQWYRLLTATFLHVELWHIATNMVMLWVIGPALEAALGRIRFLAVYLVSGLAGSAFAFLLAGGFMNSLGASGAIFGLLGATVVMYKRTRMPLGPVVALLVFNLIVTFSVTGIDWRAHLGGLIAGTLTAIGLMYAPQDRRLPVQALTVAAMAGLVLAMVLVGMARYGG
ncbi:rhomboid family intramembrane serine protease [Streptomyces sp. CB01881]|uniref:rhomboid family intramembrane serine protease n=1 Tax=Streptomyces sp. CB01881 TaxID=2078691 RepID=UPI000CDBD18D|nr:rhomboid family intramembrane serine protease [Streptomyces sp. CB01881]AUY50738.1 rhomboid family intramembrane serine protease [Streptomyces sp. CB01881]TYC74124.1 rhomboid family intramembrane serine protease [Streptomyces sp. CB01881]